MVMFVMMKTYITTCCKEKSTILGEIPMLERYVSDRIEAIYQKSVVDKAFFFVLSGKFGLLTPSNKIPFYDLVLKEDRVVEITKKVKHQFLIYGVSEVILFANQEWINYINVIEIACKQANIQFKLSKLTDMI